MRSVPTMIEADGTALQPARRQSRGRLIVRVMLFQVKLLADGFRDIVMSPLSIAAAVFGILSRRRDPEVYFDRLMYFGRDTDRWINLFDAYDAHGGRATATLDRVAEDLEAAVRRDFEAGGVSARSAERLRQLAETLRARGGGAQQQT